MKKVKKIGILTGGGDCPGLNAVIRAVAKTVMNDHGIDVHGIYDGYEGLVEGRGRHLTYEDVSGILTQGGTILGTSNKANPFNYAYTRRGKTFYEDRSKQALANIKKWNIDALVCIGGDGTLSIANGFIKLGVPVVGVPKTIDNDVMGTDITFGFNSAVTTATEAIDKIHTTAQSHHRVMIVEVMGRYAGWLALESGVASGSDVVLMPEIPYDLNTVYDYVRSRAHKGKRFSIIVVAEGARQKGGTMIVERTIADSPDPIRLGGVGKYIGDQIEDATGIETRVTVLGHLQRGGTPTPFDRILATRYGAQAARFIAEGTFGVVVALRNKKIIGFPISKVANKNRTVPKHDPLIMIGRSLGMHFGD